MGREIKRVPLDFTYPLGSVWYGQYLNRIEFCKGANKGVLCEHCLEFARIKNIELTSYNCPNWSKYFAEVNEELRKLCEPPVGEGYQLWDTTSEGSPISPVFKTMDELCEWSEKNATIFGNIKVSKEEWKRMFDTSYDGRI